jgi:SPP1 family predicted phage head-tail adaptor
VTLYDFAEVRDPDTGAFSEEWTNPRERYAAADMISARELLAGQGVLAENTMKFTLRYDATFSQSSKIVWDGVDYHVAQVRNAEGRDRMLEVIATKRNPA